jgi:hypothetical protein
MPGVVIAVDRMDLMWVDYFIAIFPEKLFSGFELWKIQIPETCHLS